jgi:hypothetical protein
LHVEEAVMAEQTEIPFPHCPHCDFELATPALFTWEHGAWVIFCIYCPECRKTIDLHIMPAIAAAAVAAQSAEAQSSIIRH